MACRPFLVVMEAFKRPIYVGRLLRIAAAQEQHAGPAQQRVVHPIPAPSRSEVRILPRAEICNRRSSQEKAGQSAQQSSLANARRALPTSRRSNLFLIG